MHATYPFTVALLLDTNALLNAFSKFILLTKVKHTENFPRPMLNSITPECPDQFSYVRIPADTTESIESCTFDKVELSEDKFIVHIKSYFALASPESNVDRDILIKHLSEHTKQDISKTVDERTLQQIMTMTSVDIMTVSLPTAENGYIGVSMYCDDKGRSKNLPLNERATGLVMACGLVGQQLFGDVFVSRMFDDGENHWFRMDFTTKDVSSTAEWVKRTANQMARKLNSGPASLSGLANQFFSGSSMGGSETQILDNAPSAKMSGSTDKYKWYQTDDEVDITIHLPICSDKRAITVDMKPTRFRVIASDETIIEGSLDEAIIVDESTWTFSLKDKILQVSLSKKVPGKIWKDLLQ